MKLPDPLDAFLPPVRDWFVTGLGKPTQAQQKGWPAIQAGQHTLILAPTGSGKTLAAFLACLNQLWRQDPLPRGVQVLYISPLKALNNDIYRNLQLPLLGVAESARKLDFPLPAIEMGLRTGDTPPAERRRHLRQPPHVLITTPESLHLLLTSSARNMLRNVRYCIVDEIHALCPNKRGVFLALLLERLEELNPQGFVRIGLSATQRPLEVVAAYLGGTSNAEAGFRPRPVTLIDAGLRKDLDLRVICPVEKFGPLPEKSIWPAIYRLLGDQVRQHRSTIIFTNNRRTAERITTQLNEEEELARAHHGSIALEVRHQTEELLKEGRLRAVVATASLELGIDMGAVELVCQVESPGNVARALQRVGRAGHLVGQTSKGRLIAKTQTDLLEQAVLAREMMAGRVEAIQPPQNCLDILAQQIVAMVAVEDWDVEALYAVVRRAIPYRFLTPQAFEGVLEMISGRFRGDTKAFPSDKLRALQARVSWDRVHNRLVALPGSRHLALVNGGTIPDTGQYPVYNEGGLRMGELDEEFVYERRVGEVFMLGTNAWRLEDILTDRVIVSPAQGTPALIPFWHGEKTGRSYDLGLAMGQFLRELPSRIDRSDCQDWLEKEFHLEPAAARNLQEHVRRQLGHAGCVPTDRNLYIEATRDQLGDWQVLLLSPFGTRVHYTLRLALEAVIRRRLGYSPQCLHHDDGVLVRLTDAPAPILDLLDGIAAENLEDLILAQLADSALFALRFRQNAARALLTPRARAGGRSPLWLQRLRGRDLLQVARRQPDFPIVAETYRECLHQHLDIDHVKEILNEVKAGRISVTARQATTPSPFASTLLFSFTMAYMYAHDAAEADPSRQPALDRQLLDQLVTPEKHAHLLDPRAINQVDRRVRGRSQPPRTAAEMAEWLRRCGDLTSAELEGSTGPLVKQLAVDNVAKVIHLRHCRDPERWILCEDEELYSNAFTPNIPHEEAAETILARFLETHALVGLKDILDRYPFEPGWAEKKLQSWALLGRLVPVVPEDDAGAQQWALPDHLRQVQRTSLAIRRREVVPCPPEQLTDFLFRWQNLHPAHRRSGEEGLEEVLARLEGVTLSPALWEQWALPARLSGYQPSWLDDLIESGQCLWTCLGDSDADQPAVGFFRRQIFPESKDIEGHGGDASNANIITVRAYLNQRGASFVSDIAQGTELLPGIVRSALWSLMRQGIVTNDRFDVVRRGEASFRLPVERQLRQAGTRGMRGAASRGRNSQRGEGRWALLARAPMAMESQALSQARLLLNRYGIVSRELAQADASLLPWRTLYGVFIHLELTGEVRRGYFVEGLSGMQFALPEAARQLQELGDSFAKPGAALLVHSLDPANLYGSGAPFDFPLLDSPGHTLSRRMGNWLVVRSGRPVLLAEQYGKRINTSTKSTATDLAETVGCLESILRYDAGLTKRHKLTVETWNELPVLSSAGREFLAAAGFVPDYNGMTLYRGA